MHFLIIQTAFIGDVILATSIIEKLHSFFPKAKIDVLVKKGNEGLFNEHPFVNNVFCWDKNNAKFKNLFKLIKDIRKVKYNYVINVHRFFSSGIITLLANADKKIGFDKNPLSFLYHTKIIHQIGNGKHEVERNHQLIQNITDDKWLKPKLYPSKKDFEAVSAYVAKPYVCIAPTSVWYTKQLPKEKWVELINTLDKNFTIYLLGALADFDFCEQLKSSISNSQLTIFNLSGKFTLLQSAALMKGAQMNYVNDSAPMHLASSVNAPVTVFFCSTTPVFGFGPLSDNSTIIETKEKLACRPCGLHGYKACPQGHFRCANTIAMY